MIPMILRHLLLLSLLTSAALADDDFPGLKQVMTPSEWAHSGLDQLAPDQIAIIDSALTRHYAHTVDQAARDSTARAVKAVQAQQARAAQVASSASSERKPSGGWLDSFGFSDERNWRDEPVLKATVIDWVSSNRFVLNNNQVWEGEDYIPYELKGHRVEIQPRPFGEFALVVDGKNTTIRVKRIQ
jgi:hypothetical protein